MARVVSHTQRDQLDKHESWFQQLEKQINSNHEGRIDELEKETKALFEQDDKLKSMILELISLIPEEQWPWWYEKGDAENDEWVKKYKTQRKEF